MRTIFDEKLAEIHNDLIELGGLVNKAIAKSVKSFVDHDVQLAKEVIEEDLVINKKENEIDRKCSEIIALQQPNTSDLRRVIAVIRAASDLERMGDHATNVAEGTINVKGQKRNEELEDIIITMGKKVGKMSVDIINAFIDFDVVAAKEVAERDEELDNYYNLLRLTAIEAMREDPEVILASSDYTFIGRDLERIGDYITNIAEGLIYLDSGKIVDLG